jgi:hypothetical protein
LRADVDVWGWCWICLCAINDDLLMFVLMCVEIDDSSVLICWCWSLCDATLSFRPVLLNPVSGSLRFNNSVVALHWHCCYVPF